MGQDDTSGGDPLRWLLVDEYTTWPGEPDLVVGACAEVDGLFAGPAPLPPPERFVLIGCAPGGALRAALDGSDGCSCVQELFDVRVVGGRPSAAGPGLVDVELRAYLRVLPELGWPPFRQPDVAGFLLAGDDGPLGTCLGTEGIFRQRVRPPARPAVLRGLRAEPWLAAVLAAGGRSPGIAAEVRARERNGDVVGTGVVVSGQPVVVVPSSRGPGLLDVTLDDGVDEPLPAGAREIWDLWHDGGPDRPGLWSGYDRGLRRAWASAAMHHQRHPRPDRPPGTVYDLDGGSVTDLEGFYCALGEAVNGPGGYFGWNLAAVEDCLCGGWGARPPFRLVWHRSEVARGHLVPGFDRPADDLRFWGPAVTLDDLVRLLGESGVDVELR